MKIPKQAWWAGFAVAAVLQLAFLSSNILRWETALAKGDVFRFRCEPIDPYDPFRGRYVVLNLGRFTVPAAGGEEYRGYGEQAYALLEEDEEGFATLTTLLTLPPKSGDFVKCKVIYRDYSELGKWLVELNNDRFFMNEKLAPEAESAFSRALMMEEETEAWAQARVYRGDVIIEDVLVDGVSIAEMARRSLKNGSRRE